MLSSNIPTENFATWKMIGLENFEVWNHEYDWLKNCIKSICEAMAHTFQ